MRLIINSSKLNLTDDNKIRFYLPYTIEIHEFHLINCSIPYSFYNVNNYNNSVLFNNTLFTIPSKQYNAIQLRNALKTILGITVLFDRQSLKFTLTSPNPFTFNALNLGYILGFQNQYTYNSVYNFSTATSSITSDNACDVTNRVHNIYIKSNIAPPNIFENGIEGCNILYRIPILSSFGSIIYYQNTSDKNLNTEVNQAINMIEIQLTDTFDNPLNFNNCTYQLEFYMRTVDDEEIIRSYNRYLMGGAMNTV